MITRDADYYHELQTQTGWGRTLFGFAKWCAPQTGWVTLDVGCGPGLLPRIFAQMGCRAMGVDLDEAMFKPGPLHPDSVVGDIYQLPFKSQAFDLVTASNLVFLLAEPEMALMKMKTLLAPGGRVAMLNPSEELNEPAAIRFAEENGLIEIARQTLVNWARRAEANHHWTENETCEIYRHAGMRCVECVLKVGPGFGRFSRGIIEIAG